LQYDYQASPVREDRLRVSKPDRTYAGFVQAEWQVSYRWKAYTGMRYDVSANYRDAVSPRLALVYEQSPKTSYKFVYGRPFRNPSAYEQYYDDNGLTAVAAGPLRSETAHTLEVSVERKLSTGVTATLTAYQYRLQHLIEAVYLDGGISQFHNMAGARSTGIEAEVAGKPRTWLESAASWTYQRATAFPSREELTNSPRHIAKVRAGVPLARNLLFLSAAARYVSSRATLSGPPVGGATLFDLTLSTDRISRQFDFVAGVRNSLSRRYEDPVGLLIDRLQTEGRVVFVKLIWHATAE
jgi:outer membrane receptor for ferrienterochelin and colicins